MEHAVLNGRWIKISNIYENGNPDDDVYYMEVVKEKIKKGWGLSTQIITEEIILKYCPFCSKVL